MRGLPAAAALAAVSGALLFGGCRDRSASDAPGGKRAPAPSEAPLPVDTSAAPLRVDTLAPVASQRDALALAQDGSFDAFYVAFRAAVARRDADAVRSVLSPTVTSSFGDDPTPEAFFRAYPLDDPASPAWNDLAGLLGSPAGEQDGARVFPAAFAATPPADLAAKYPDAELLSVVKPAAVRTARGETLAALDPGTWLPMCATDDGVPDDAYCVVLPDGRTGLVPDDAVFSPYGLRLGFAREGGKWRLAFLVAGD